MSIISLSAVVGGRAAGIEAGLSLTTWIAGCWCCRCLTVIRTTRNNGEQWASG